MSDAVDNLQTLLGKYTSSAQLDADNVPKEDPNKLGQDKRDLSNEYMIADYSPEMAREKVKQEGLRLNAASTIAENLKVELEAKSKLRRILVYFLMVYFTIVTIGVGIIICQPISVVSEKVKIALVTGLFGNLLGLLIVVYKYAFSDTSNSTKDIDLLINKEVK
ncbi:hypothetical protein [Leuconostoc gelidum]|uniref:hypothetical protein n=1 Tax=Leuconostoc gelidum TaxID=1244 RepID=UPI001CC769CB|nr:hypothetical protein [Leuconostoc gelidum]MBZ6000942.1 hypothetical protein [Leuconostoc gelidum subsp. gelidum]